MFSLSFFRYIKYNDAMMLGAKSQAMKEFEQ